MGAEMFYPGDIVALIEDEPDFNQYLRAGDTGIVCPREDGLMPGWVSVEWDHYCNGHNCGGSAKPGYGYNVPTSTLRVLEDDEDNASLAADLLEMLYD